MVLQRNPKLPGQLLQQKRVCSNPSNRRRQRNSPPSSRPSSTPTPQADMRKGRNNAQHLRPRRARSSHRVHRPTARPRPCRGRRQHHGLPGADAHRRHRRQKRRVPAARRGEYDVSIRLRAYSIQGQRAAFDAFDAFTADAAFGNSAVLFEGYSTLAVKAVPSDGTAFAFRGDNLLMYVYRRLPLSALRRKTLCLRVQLKG